MRKPRSLSTPSPVSSAWWQYFSRLSPYYKWNSRLKKCWSELSFPAEEIQWVTQLYNRYAPELELVRKEQLAFFEKRHDTGLVPQLCDVEAEMTYMRIRECKPSTVVEISPASGWSTTWILQALKRNGSGSLYSYDLVDDSTRVVPAELREGRWQFFQGDIKQNLASLPPRAEYLFIDSDHSAEFAHWYIDTLFPMYGAGTWVSVHDILKWSHEPGWGEESLVLCSWLLRKHIACITASRIFKTRGSTAILKARDENGINRQIQRADYNSMIFFKL